MFVKTSSYVGDYINLSAASRILHLTEEQNDGKEKIVLFFGNPKNYNIASFSDTESIEAILNALKEKKA